MFIFNDRGLNLAPIVNPPSFLFCCHFIFFLIRGDFFSNLYCGSRKSITFVEIIKTTDMKNTDFIKQNYKSSTIARIMERYGYETEQGIDIDPDITYALEVSKQNDPHMTQDFLFQVLDEIHESFNNMMDELYPNGLFNF